MTTMAYPFEITPSGKVATVDGDAAMLQQVEMVLSTSLGSRVMRPEFGSKLPTQVFDSLDVGAEEEFRSDVQRAVKRAVAGAHIPRVDVDVDEDRGLLNVVVHVSSQREVVPRPLAVTLAFGRVAEDHTP